MPRIAYIPQRFSRASRKVLETADQIMTDYARQGYTLTLRQLYYQFVARDLLPNTTQSYKRLGSIVNDGRVAGLLDWDGIEDRTRTLHQLGAWGSPAHIIRDVTHAYRKDLWAGQNARVEVWVEKDALAGVFLGICDQLRVPLFACRGYTSQSEMWAAGQRLKDYAEADQVPVILHFGDHDPSGIDMTRDIIERLRLFSGLGPDLVVERLALNMDQVRQYEPPPNPAKVTDSRFDQYVAHYGVDQSWELDALDPATLNALVRGAVARYVDDAAWATDLAQESEGRHLLRLTHDHWPAVAAFVQEKDS